MTLWPESFLGLLLWSLLSLVEIKWKILFLWVRAASVSSSWPVGLNTDCMFLYFSTFSQSLLKFQPFLNQTVHMKPVQLWCNPEWKLLRISIVFVKVHFIYVPAPEKRPCWDTHSLSQNLPVLHQKTGGGIICQVPQKVALKFIELTSYFPRATMWLNCVTLEKPHP